jgi:ABC-type amino acid transport substrate-binding protein
MKSSWSPGRDRPKHEVYLRRRWALLLLIPGLLAQSSMTVRVVSAQTAPLMLVSTAWPPFTNPRGQPRFALDLVETALGRIGLTANTTIVGAPEFTSSLLAGRFDGSAAAWKDSERENALIFSQPYLENRLVLVGRSGAAVSAKTLGELAGRRVAVVEGYSYGDAIDRAGPLFVRSRSEEDSLAQLLKGGVEYTLMDELVVQYIVSNYPKESGTRLQIGSTPLLTRQLYFAVRRTRGDAQSIIARFDAQLRGMIADRTYHRLLHLDWLRADVTGDGVPEDVPLNDRPGPSPPQRVYSLFSRELVEPTAKPGFYIGGTLYNDWASVPESYKEVNPQYPDARRSSASVFTFAW